MKGDDREGWRWEADIGKWFGRLPEPCPMPTEASIRCKVCGIDLFPLNLSSQVPWTDMDLDEAICLEGSPEIEEGARTGELDHNPFHSPELYWM